MRRKTSGVRTVDLAFGATMASLALAIPIMFRGVMQFTIPDLGYSATLASHVPSMVSVLAGPIVAFMVGLASAIGFTLTLSPVVGLRAFTHAIWGASGALAYRGGWSFLKVMVIIALPIHAIGEALAVVAFGVPFTPAFLVVGGGTVIHHFIDVFISVAVIRIAKPILGSIVLTGIRIR